MSQGFLTHSLITRWDHNHLGWSLRSSMKPKIATGACAEHLHRRAQGGFSCVVNVVVARPNLKDSTLTTHLWLYPDGLLA